MRLPVVDEIDPAVQPPVHEFPIDASRVDILLDRPARLLTPGDGPKVMAWVLGRARGLKPGAAYLLEVDYPDDLPRTLFIANRARISCAASRPGRQRATAGSSTCNRRSSHWTIRRPGNGSAIG